MRESWAARVLAAMVLAVLLAGCGDGGETTAERPPGVYEVNVVLNGRDGPENVGILMADERGYFKDAGLFPTITSPSTPERPVDYVSSGLSDIGISHQPQVVLAKEEGVPIVAVGNVIAEPTAAMIWLEKSEIGGIEDLRGKTIAIPGIPFQRNFLESVLAQAGLALKDVTVKVVGYELVPALVKGRADAAFGGSENFEGAVLESRGLKPVITPVTNLGIPSYDELTLIANQDFLYERPRLVRAFTSAMARGTEAAIEDPEAALKVVEKSLEADPDLSRKGAEAALEATLPLLSEDGQMDPEQASELVSWMRDEGMVQREISASELLTNEYLESE
jgi:putative hydroxymethylpyrimidine transport system substrate-binding protein